MSHDGKKGRNARVQGPKGWGKSEIRQQFTWRNQGLWDYNKWRVSISKVVYVEGLQHNLISVSQLVVGTGLKVSFNDEGSEIIKKATKNVLLKSKQKGEMYPLNLNPIK